MPGQFSKANRPARPGAYVNFEALPRPVIAPNIASIVAIPFIHDWGPFKTPVLVQSFAEWQAYYGLSTDTPGYMAVKMAFQGEDVPGYGGAGAVLAYRFGDSTGAPATKVLQNMTPAAALTLTAKYPGTKGNDLRVTVQDDPGVTTKDELILLDGTTVLETYVYTDTDVAGLANQINVVSQWVTAHETITGVKLGYISGVSLAGGDDGDTPVASDWTDLMSAVEVERFGLFAPYDMVDSAIVSSLVAWTQNLNKVGKRFMLVLGGDTDEVVADAISDAQSIQDPNVCRVGVGSVSDSLTPDANGDPTVFSTSQLAPRIAGILAARGEAKSITFARLRGIKILNGPTESEILQAFNGGVIVLARDSNLQSPVRIEKALTTWTLTTDDTRPYIIYRNPKFVRTMHGFEHDLTDWSVDNVIGKLPVNDSTRTACIAQAGAFLKARQETWIVQPGWTVEVDPDPPPSDDDEFVALLVGIKFGRSVEQVYWTVRVG
jgi:hypothetical protein